MKPVGIFQHTEVGAPGSIPGLLAELGVPARVLRIVDGEAVPQDPQASSGLVFMGGYMAVHDDLPWIAQELALIRRAVALGIPVIGHCLGSQLLATALGAEVTRAERSEIGWSRIGVAPGALAQEWFGQPAGEQLLTFQWHGDTFGIPPGAERIAGSAHCPNQAFVADGRHLAIQSHLEMTPALVALSVERNGAQMERQEAAGNPACSPRAEVLDDLDARTAEMRATLKRLYERWIQGLRA
ncbi:type 1 glutamine amidotransferase [Comamonas endophytica]|uniref:Type 1 glutamine amidotransferase n=1 Tax=Comamonas endophytica TaxID=2949090 RepID=A0ABY6GEW6_9BURK|nr:MULTISPECIES: type 1 glutamine amidotransferase [unclassified Acidovorax]MCD2512581.1 type 1 glutamine amidotransferase [Acidovorax sp. D4N7]UYG53057.1 type 1 glutamine amidotransferase [Acidovorax sp. 5MLIR]